MNAPLDRKCVGEHCEIKDAEAGEVTAIVATLNVVDRDGDVLLPGSFPADARVKLSAYGHDVVMDGAAPVGLGSISVEGNKAILRGRYFLSTTRGRDAFNTVKELGDEGEFSFGYPRAVTTAPMSNEWRTKGARRLVAGITPIEASAVFRGAGVGTGLLSAKCDGCGSARGCGCHGRSSIDETVRRGKALLAQIKRSAPALAPVPTRAQLARRVEAIDGKMATFITATATVSDWTRETARNWATAVEAVLGLEPARIVWAVASAKALGQFRPDVPGTIYLSPRLKPHQIGPTVIHEQIHRFCALSGRRDPEWVVERDTQFLWRRLA